MTNIDTYVVTEGHLNYFRKLLMRAIGTSREEIVRKQLEMLEDSIIIYRLRNHYDN